MTREFFFFLLAGTIGFAVDTGLLYALLASGAGYFAGRCVSFLVAVWVTWRINRRYTFQTERHESLWAEWSRYFCDVERRRRQICDLCGGGPHFAAERAASSFAVAIGAVAGLAVNFHSAK